MARYPGGSIGGVDVEISGRVHFHADLAPNRSSRYVVTLPVGFRRRGVAGIDVTAEGVPRSEGCGTRGMLRRSDPRTLGVRVGS